jgi:hypothetical protein
VPVKNVYTTCGRPIFSVAGSFSTVLVSTYLERLLRVRGICEFLRRGGGAIVDIPCPRCKLYLSGDGEGGFRAEEEHPVVVLRRQFAS